MFLSCFAFHRFDSPPADPLCPDGVAHSNLGDPRLKVCIQMCDAINVPMNRHSKLTEVSQQISLAVCGNCFICACCCCYGRMMTTFSHAAHADHECFQLVFTWLWQHCFFGPPFNDKLTNRYSGGMQCCLLCFVCCKTQSMLHSKRNADVHHVVV